MSYKLASSGTDSASGAPFARELSARRAPGRRPPALTMPRGAHGYANTAATICCLDGSFPNGYTVPMILPDFGHNHVTARRLRESLGTVRSLGPTVDSVHTRSPPPRGVAFPKASLVA